MLFAMMSRWKALVQERGPRYNEKGNAEKDDGLLEVRMHNWVGWVKMA